MSQGIRTMIEMTFTFRTLSKLTGIPYKVLWRRYARGDRGERLVRPVEAKYGHRGNWSDDENDFAHP